MSWLLGGPQQPGGSQSQRELSPPPTLCSQPHTSQSSAPRVVGADITNRSPTPTPALHPSVKSVASVSPASPSTARALKPVYDTRRERQRDLLGCETAFNSDEDFCSVACFVVPSHETFFHAMVSPSSQQARRRSRSMDAAIPLQSAAPVSRATARGGDWRRWTDVGDEKAPEGDSDGVVQPLKRARPQANAAAASQQALFAISDSEAPKDASRSTVLDGCASGQKKKSVASSGFFTPISTNLLLLSTGSSNKPSVAESTSTTAIAATRPRSPEWSFGEVYAEEQHGDRSRRLRTPSPPSIPTSSGTTPNMQNGSVAHLCQPARLLDTTTPCWQVLTAVAATASTAGPHDELLATARRGGRRVRIVSAVDSTVVYSPGSLEDISPICCLSEDRSMPWRSGAQAWDNGGTPPHLRNEEFFPRGRAGMDGGHNCDAPFLAPQPLFPHSRVDDDEEEDTQKRTSADICRLSSTTPYLPDAVLCAASHAQDELHRSLTCWQR